MWHYYRSILRPAVVAGFADWRAWATFAAFVASGLAYRAGTPTMTIPWPWFAWGLGAALVYALLRESYRQMDALSAERDELAGQVADMCAAKVRVTGVSTDPQSWDRLPDGRPTWRVTAAVVVENLSNAALHLLHVRLESCQPGDGFWHRVGDDLPHPLRESTDDPPEGQPFQTHFTLAPRAKLVFLVAVHDGPTQAPNQIWLQLASRSAMGAVEEFRRVSDPTTGKRHTVRGRYRLLVRVTAEEMGTPGEEEFLLTTDEKGILVFQKWELGDEVSPD